MLHIVADNDIDGATLAKLSEVMIAKLLPTMKLQVKFMDLQKSLLAGIAQHQPENRRVQEVTPSQHEHVNSDTSLFESESSGQNGYTYDFIIARYNNF